MGLYEIRKQARVMLQGKWGMAIMASVVVSLISNGPTLIVQLVASISSTAALLISNISIVSIFLLPITIGLNRFFLDLYEQKPANLDRVFYAFKNGRYAHSLGAMLLMFVFIFLWSMLFFIPGIIKAFSYAMTPYILADPKYDQVPAQSTITISRRLMDGHKLDLFVLQLYYTWWYYILIFGAAFMIGFGYEMEIAYGVIGVATVIYTFYTTPLLLSATATFYSDIKKGPHPVDPTPQKQEDTSIDPAIPSQPKRYDPLAWDYEDDSFEESPDDNPSTEDETDDDSDDDNPFFY